jgi:hypothetical protein
MHMPKRKNTSKAPEPDMPKDTNHDLIGEKGGLSEADYDADIAVMDEEILSIPDIDDTVIIEDMIDNDTKEEIKNDEELP